MKIIVKAKTKAKVDKVERITQPSLSLQEDSQDLVVYKVSTKEAPSAGRANMAITRLLADYFDVSVVRIHLLTGHTSKQKIFEII